MRDEKGRFTKGHPNLHKRKGKYVDCTTCKKSFYVCIARIGKKKFCSIPCKSKSQIGKMPWNKGLTGLQDWHNISGLNSRYWVGKRRLDITGNKHWYWKETPSYYAMHSWIRRRLGQPQNCTFCGVEGKKNGRNWSIQYANKSREYKRDIADWLPLCAGCHKQYDMGLASVQKYENI